MVSNHSGTPTTPSVTIGTVILADYDFRQNLKSLAAKENTSSPLSLSHVWTPFLPVFLPLPILFQTLLFFSQILVVVNFDHDGKWLSAN
jgi:hypothetical protein